MAKNKTKYRRRLHQVSKRRNRQRAFMLDGGRCYLCRRRLKMAEMTLDHVLPRAAGGTGHHANLRAACYPCNGAKGDWSYTELLLGFRLGGDT